MGNSRFVALVVVFLLSISIVACTAEAAEPTAVPITGGSNGPADITGRVSHWAFIEGEGSMLVEGKNAQGAEYAAQVRVTGQTQIIRQVEGEMKAGEITQLKEGQTVEVRFDGSVAESYPVQSKAG